MVWVALVGRQADFAAYVVGAAGDAGGATLWRQGGTGLRAGDAADFPSPKGSYKAVLAGKERKPLRIGDDEDLAPVEARRAVIIVAVDRGIPEPAIRIVAVGAGVGQCV